MDNDKLKPLLYNPYIISSGFAMDVRDWDDDQLQEYQKMVAENRAFDTPSKLISKTRF